MDDTDTEEYDINFLGPEPMYETVDIETLEEIAKRIGKTNATFNYADSLLKTVRMMQDEGLEPVVIHLTLTNSYMVTSQEFLDKKYN